MPGYTITGCLDRDLGDIWFQNEGCPGPFPFTVSTSLNRFIISGYDYAPMTRKEEEKFLVATTGILPSPLNINTYYYPLSAGTNFQIAEEPDGSVIDITTIGTGIHTFLKSNFYSYFACIVRDESVHHGQIAITPQAPNCRDTYYGCLDPNLLTFEAYMPLPYDCCMIPCENCFSEESGYLESPEELTVEFTGINLCCSNWIAPVFGGPDITHSCLLTGSPNGGPTTIYRAESKNAEGRANCNVNPGFRGDCEFDASLNLVCNECTFRYKFVDSNSITIKYYLTDDCTGDIEFEATAYPYVMVRRLGFLEEANSIICITYLVEFVGDPYAYAHILFEHEQVVPDTGYCFKSTNINNGRSYCWFNDPVQLGIGPGASYGGICDIVEVDPF